MAVDYTSDYWEHERISSQDTCDVITALKKIFVRWGIPVQVQSDNGPQFTSQQFVHFAKEWCFTHTTSSLHYPQSNGKVESAVKIAKRILRRCADPELALLEFRNTTTENMTTSPIERLLGRSTRSTLPSDAKVKLSRAEQLSSEEKRAKRQRTTTQCNKSSKNLSPLKIGEPVMLRDYRAHQRSWKEAQVHKTLSDRSYAVVCDGEMFRRNRRDLRPKLQVLDNNQPDPVRQPCEVAENMALQNRPLRVCREPAWLNDYDQS
ncbi:uncharacterized protein [Watersipora subatra]|uniref:uncharacterized protein n=1 Tax=Watersipora subatra TaxID=2589382 RepID=UPI00355AD3EE